MISRGLAGEQLTITPLRLGLVIGQLTVGGAEGQLWELVRRLDNRFVPTVYSLTDRPAALTHELSSIGVTVRVVGGRGMARVRRLARMLCADDIDLVHAWLFIANGYAMGAKLCGARQPLITSARNRKVQGLGSRLANMLAFRCSQAIVVNSGDVATYVVRQYWAPAPRVQVIPNGVDTARFRPADAVCGAAVGPIVTVGRLVVQKNHELFLQAAAELCHDCPQARFLIVGDGPLRPALEARARQLTIADRVSFVGERRDIETVMRSASLFWLTSRWEGMPNVVLEAMASGVPVIATDVGGTRELIRSAIDGWVVPDQDGAAFVRHSRELLHDAALRQRFGAAARCRAEEFSTARMVGALSQLYVDVASGRR